MKRAKFSLSNHKLLSCDMGELVPIGIQEVLAGDSIQQSTGLLLRVSPLLAPVMHPVQVRIHHWFVPHRLVWEDWEDFITGGPEGDDESILPTREVLAAAGGTLPDYFGMSPPASGSYFASALPFRGYALIWNEYYRDQDLQTKLAISTASGVDTTINRSLQNVCWEKDYFTSSRPWPQKGPEITISIGDTAPVVSDGQSPIMFTAQHASGKVLFFQSSTGMYGPQTTTNWPASQAATYGPDGTGQTGLKADLSAATPISINELREAFALQRFAEARSRFGSEYIDYLRYLGVRSSDARLQRPEYLGGGKQTIQFSEVLQTGVTTSGNALGVGNMRGHGISALRSNRYRRFFEEHGYIFTLLSVRPKTIYAQSVPRTYLREDREDFFQKELAHIGQQEVFNREVYSSHSAPTGVFGYQDRYDEYRRSESSVAGEFRTSVLDFWHQARIFTSDPTLNASFVSCTPTKRINAVTTNDVLWIMAHHSIQARRIVPRTGSSFIF